MFKVNVRPTGDQNEFLRGLRVFQERTHSFAHEPNMPLFNCFVTHELIHKIGLRIRKRQSFNFSSIFPWFFLLTPCGPQR